MAKNKVGFKAQGENKAKSAINSLFSGFFENRKKIRDLKNEMEFKNVSNNRTKNEDEICSILASISFGRIPEKLASIKTDPKQKICDLALTIQLLQAEIKNNMVFSVDTKELDGKIKTLAEELRKAVDAGNIKRITAAQSCLIRCIIDIRNDIPNIPSSQAQEFLDSAVKYADNCINYVAIAADCDNLEREVNEKKELLLDREEEFRKMIDWLKKDVVDPGTPNEELHKSYLKTLDLSMPTADAVSDWTTTDIELRRKIIRMYVLKSLNALDRQAVLKCSGLLETRKGQLESMITLLTSQPKTNIQDTIIACNKAMDDFIDDLVRIDQEFADGLETFTNISKRANDLNNTKGAKLIDDIIQKTGKDILREMREEQNLPGKGMTRDEEYRILGLRTPEEQMAYEEEYKKRETELNEELNIQMEQPEETTDNEPQTNEQDNEEQDN